MPTNTLIFLTLMNCGLIYLNYHNAKWQKRKGYKGLYYSTCGVLVLLSLATAFNIYQIYGKLTCTDCSSTSPSKTEPKFA